MFKETLKIVAEDSQPKVFAFYVNYMHICLAADLCEMLKPIFFRKYFSILSTAVLGPVVQRVISLTSSLMVKMLTVLVSIISNSQVFLLKKCE